MSGHAARGMSAPPEVVFSTATDPDRSSAWLPEPLRAAGEQRSQVDAAELHARWNETDGGWAAEIRVEPGPSGGARVRLELHDGSDGSGLDDLAEKSLANLADAVADNLTAG
ncbi:hypothetical protein ABT336_03165 [Micromonospora sp. NPDC000207]|uniref:hypothetical protein n=1 Tax=Micromonospora sp. NPDC000207 TaxID=3154246 RepID=UPI003318AB01